MLSAHVCYPPSPWRVHHYYPWHYYCPYPEVVYVPYPVPVPVAPVLPISVLPPASGKVEIKIEISTTKPKLSKKQSRRW